MTRVFGSRKKFLTLIVTALFVSLFAILPASASVPPNYVSNGSFEVGNFNGWTVTGNAFTVTNDTDWGWGGPFNHVGTYHVWGYKNAGDDATGTLKSTTFYSYWGKLYVDFLIGGGNDIDNLYVALINNETGEELYRATGENSETYRRVIWPIPYGVQFYFKVVDNKTGGWGHINVDDFHGPGETIVP
ncbi:hypothetical protein [Paenibacillus caui]|uniref:hypothetical protein n=1 Tax=Paenibacillus caui TaxID=2873927 RepID=UPI001CA93BC8|nr:hypothetical protein [Paenibacillus caui]